MTIFDDGIDSLFGNDDLAVDGSYTPAGGSPASVRVIVQYDVELVTVGQGDVMDRRIVISVRKSEIAAPGRGDTILIGSTTYTVDVPISDDGYETKVSVR